MNELGPSEKVLKTCKATIKNTVPAEYAYQQGFLFVINNNLAQLENRRGNVQGSLDYLIAAIENAKDPRVRNTDELPLAETYLNVANANAFLTKYSEALSHAEKAFTASSQTCERIEHVLSDPSLNQD